MGQTAAQKPQNTLSNRLIRQSKDWMDTEFPFSSFSHKLDVDKKGESYEHHRTCSYFIDPAHPSIQHIARTRRVDTPTGSKLLATQLRFYGSSNVFSPCCCWFAPAVGAPNPWNRHTYVLPAQTGCPLAGRSSTYTGIHPKS